MEQVMNNLNCNTSRDAMFHLIIDVHYEFSGKNNNLDLL